MTASKFDLNAITSLCLACSSSLPPKASVDSVFVTPCCRQPICHACSSKNPRLTRYNPCLSCLGGVDVVNARAVIPTQSSKTAKAALQSETNIDGAVRDEDTYVIGEDEDDDGLDGELDSNPPPPYLSSPDSSPGTNSLPDELSSSEQIDPSVNPHNPYQYYIKKGDTLQGIALKFGVDGRELCRLNKLPPSALSTTPHILHTRGVITLPPNARLFDKQGNQFSNDPKTIEEENARAVRRIRHQAEGRLQFITHEADWRVAKAYVALAEDPDELAMYDVKRKENGSVGLNLGPHSSSLSAAAVDRYLEDEEWEKTEGKNMSIPSFPGIPNKS
ncbi:hypothetical protein D9758_003801 [Tetrapyrgos nigripes]|uniref:LysM domain-containing protein n=1 Tax=Tetrapyrgos nigripes TaxID=182062 RepID=A0A8H5GME4_9AGAR|nr:hypothetical protein D9758_003801 [Tetrapyrgos nigripes]